MVQSGEAVSELERSFYSIENEIFSIQRMGIFGEALEQRELGRKNYFKNGFDGFNLDFFYRVLRDIIKVRKYFVISCWIVF